MKENYITAVLDKLKAGDDPEKVLEGLKKTLKNKGHERLYASILRGVARVLEAGSTDSVVVTVANEAAYAKQKAVIEDALKTLNAEAEPKVVVDETIIGGYMAEANSSRLDKSYKTKLVNLYRSLTNAS